MRYRWIIVTTIALCGCYEYLPSPSRSDDLNGKRVQLTLNDMGSAMLAPQIGPQNEAVGGTLVENTSEALTLLVQSVRNRNGLESGWNGERVSVPRSYIETLEERRFSVRRTFFASAALAASLIIAQKAFGGGGGATVPGNGAGGPGSPR